MKIDFLPHLESFMCKQKFESKFFIKNPIQSHNGVLPICKLPFPNGSYRNGVCRALWAIIEINVPSWIVCKTLDLPLIEPKMILVTLQPNSQALKPFFSYDGETRCSCSSCKTNSHSVQNFNLSGFMMALTSIGSICQTLWHSPEEKFKVNIFILCLIHFL